MRLRGFSRPKGGFIFSAKGKREEAENGKELTQHMFSNDCVGESEINTSFAVSHLTQAIPPGIIIRQGN